MRHLLMMCCLIIEAGCLAADGDRQLQTPASQKAVRITLKRLDKPFELPKHQGKDSVRSQGKKGEADSYDPEPEILTVDAKAGKYGLRWTGYSGKRLTAFFQRPDQVDVTVNASVVREDNGIFLYRYHIENMASSGQHLTGFVLQTLSSNQDFKQTETIRDDVYVAPMSLRIPEFKEGTWLRFAILKGTKLRIEPGQAVDFQLRSAGAPGLAGCRAHGGDFGIKGAGEELPDAFLTILPGYGDWPSGYTIGPVDSLEQLSQPQRMTYLLDRLAEFQRLGWVSPTAVKWYQENLAIGDLRATIKHAEADLTSGVITSEMFAMLQAIKE